MTVVRTIAVLVVALSVLGASAPAGAGGGVFEATISPLDAATRALMTGRSWHEGCPAGLDELRAVRLTYWGFDGAVHRGRLVVHRRWARDVVAVFGRLFAARFPIRRIRLVDRYGADDDASMRHDNTSAFNCRYVSGTTTWSQHAYGRAIDVNPVENPYVVGSHVSPPAGRAYLDRSDARPGMIVAHGVVVRAFRRIGWGWGGSWAAARDYQHFSANGR